MCKRSVCQCGFPYSWAEPDPYKRAEKQCKMADMIKPKKYDGKMPEDIEKFFTEKTRVTETENEVSRTLILGNSAFKRHINSDTLNCKDAMGVTAVTTYGATKEDLFNRPMNVDATAKMMLWSIKGMPQPASDGSGSNCSHMDLQRASHSAVRRAYLQISKQVLEAETAEIDWSDKDAMRQLEDKWAMHSEWCKATLNDLLAAENTEVVNFIKG